MRSKVVVWGTQHEVTVQQQSKSVWIASGEYMGGAITTKDRSAGSALKRWKEAATTKGG